VGLVLAAALAGCVGAVAPGVDGEIGVENGVRYDAELSINGSDGLNGTELQQVKSRAMARIERMRGLEFTEDVPVRVVSRAEYRANQPGPPPRTAAMWNNQVWEGLFLVGEGRNVSAVFDELRGSTVQGYYTASGDEIVIVSDADTPRVRRGTLVHELVHALQDQQFGIGGQPSTQDRQIARNAVVEGEAVTLTTRYERRCGEEWDCAEIPGVAVGGRVSNPGVFAVLYQPYQSGPRFVDAIRERGGWDAVSALHDGYPASSEQTIHPRLYPDERPVEVTVPNRSSGAWSRFDHDPVADTVGEASVYAMVLANGVGEAPAGRYSYEHPVSAGWAGDSLVPYRNGDRFGYVWATEWDSPADARQFHRGYLELLDSKGAVDRGDGVYVIEEPPFADAFRVTREGTAVRIVNAPTVPELEDVHAR
jgi:hypothetical protein